MNQIEKSITNSGNDKSRSDKPRFFFHKSGVNVRNAVRYANVLNTTELYSKKRFLSAVKPIPVKVYDISSRGARIASNKKLKVNSDYVLKIKFADRKKFEIAGKVIRKESFDENCYGFKFNAYNDKLGEYLFRTLTEVIFNQQAFKF